MAAKLRLSFIRGTASLDQIIKIPCAATYDMHMGWLANQVQKPRTPRVRGGGELT